VDKTITLLLQLSLIIPLVMVIVAALVGFRILKGNPRWPSFIGVSLTTIVALTSVFYFSPTIQQQSYSQTLLRWLSLSDEPATTLQIGVLFDPLSLSFYLLISIASLFYLLLNDSTSTASPARPARQYTSLLFLTCFSATVGVVLATNFLQVLLFWFVLSMSLNLLHEVQLDTDSQPEPQARHWWGWNAFSDAMLLLAIFLIGVNFETFDFLSCLHADAIQAVQAKNSAALPGIGAALFFAAVPRLGLFPASALILSQKRSWSSPSLAANNLLAIPAGLFLLLRCAPFFQLVPVNQSLLIQLGTVSAVLTVFSAVCLSRGPHPDRILCWLSATVAGTAVALLGREPGDSLPLILAMIVPQMCLISVLIPLSHRLQTGTLPARALDSLNVCTLLLLISALVGLSAMLNPLITARSAAHDVRAACMIWLMLPIIAGYAFGGARFYFSLNIEPTSAVVPQKFSAIPLWVIAIFAGLTSLSLYFPVPFVQQIWPGLMTETNESPFDRDWFFCSLFCVTIIVALILAWMTSSQTHRNKSAEPSGSALIQLGESHYYALTILHRAVTGPLTLFAKIVSLVEQWVLVGFSRATLEKLPVYWGHLLQQLQNGQVAFQTLVLLFTLSVLILVLMVLQI
tara:strand:- start:136985 stop:138871 length:1887 start_codon:yes stop_codon:yes gene_type:complete